MACHRNNVTAVPQNDNVSVVFAWSRGINNRRTKATVIANGTMIRERVVAGRSDCSFADVTRDVLVRLEVERV